MNSRVLGVASALDRVASSNTFHSSRRAQEFLRYVVVHALREEFDHLKERSIGCEVFGRPPDYDTGSDAVVRVTANDVRKRLAQYYVHEGATDPVRFEMPVGSYIPKLCLVPQSSDPVTSSQLNGPLSHPDPASNWMSTSSRRTMMAGASVILLVLLVLLAWVVHSLVTALLLAPKELRRVPWSAMFYGGQTLQLIMGDSAVGSVLLVYGKPPMSLDDYANKRFAVPDPSLPLETQRLHSVLEHSYTSVADARIGARFSRLAASVNRSVSIRFARDLQLSEFHGGSNFVLLGSRMANPWVELFQGQRDFNIEWDPTSHKQFVAIRNSRPGDPQGLTESVGTGKTGRSYAILALTRGLDGKGKVLTAEGTNMEGTEVAADLMFDPDQLSSVLRGCRVGPNDPNGYFEVLMELQSTAGSAKQSRVLATRCRSSK